MKYINKYSFTINEIQKDFILKAIYNINFLYDFELTEEEFKESYYLSKSDLILMTNKLMELLK